MWKAFSSSGLRSTKRAGLPSRRSASARLTSSSVALASRPSLSLALAFLSRPSTRRSRLSRSASISSVSMVSMSATGSMRAGDMGDVGVDEAAHHVRDGVDLAHVGEELVAEPFPARGAAHEARDVHERQPGRLDLGGFGELRQHLKARVGHHHLADQRLDGAERIARCLRRRGRGQRVEDGRLADIGQAEDAAFEAHEFS